VYLMKQMMESVFDETNDESVFNETNDGKCV
jgi:hypothetical protein